MSKVAVVFWSGTGNTQPTMSLMMTHLKSARLLALHWPEHKQSIPPENGLIVRTAQESHKEPPHLQEGAAIF